MFVVATSNDVSRLPPEFIRKGRFDEIFFVDLPGARAREEIFRIHVGKRTQDVARFDLTALSSATDAFSGAEIEECIVSALYLVFAEGRPLTTDDLVQESRKTRPLSRIMAERLVALRAWASERTVSAE